MTVEKYMMQNDGCHNFYGKVRINRRSMNKTVVVNKSTDKLVRNIAFDIRNELTACGYDISVKSIFEEVESIKENLKGIVEYFYDNGFDEYKFLKSGLFQKYWKSNMPDDWQHGIITKNKLLYFRPCCIFLEKDGFSIEFND